MIAVLLHQYAGQAQKSGELVTCPCGQALESTHEVRHCPRCGVTITPR